MVHQRYQAAIEEYKKAPRNSVDAWNKMGVAYQLMYNVAEAGRCYEKALKLDPHNAVAFNNMGSVFMAEKAYSQAAKYFRKAAKQDATAALYRKNLGTALLAERKYEQGWSEYQQALALDPDIFSASGSVRVENPGTIRDRGAMNYYMAKGCLKAGQTDQAIEYLRQALNEGFTTPKKIIADAQFASLKDVPAFQKMMASQGVYLTTPGAHSTIQ
jgi:tetratricopeptide (TPR) repeat protein